VELNNGAKFYGQQVKSSYPATKYGDLEKLTKIGRLKYFNNFLITLSEQYVEGIYERYYKLNKGDIVVDAGANVGSFTVKAAEAVGKSGIVIAMEPEANSIILLRRNIEANELRNVVIIPKGVWGGVGRLRFILPPTRDGLSLYRHEMYGTRDSNEFVEVQVDTLDNILRELGIKRADFIKMDIEGAEIEALKGMNETLKDNDVKLAIAAYHTVNGKATYKTIVPWLKGKGFEVHTEGGIVYARKRHDGDTRDEK
jgi:FkbM family methyltransferase